MRAKLGRADRSPLKEAAILFAKIVVIMFLCEALIMALLNGLGLRGRWDVLLDPLLLSLAATPFLYFFVVMPIENALRISKRTELELREMTESEGLFREFVEGTSDLVTLTDSRGRIAYVNSAAKSIFGVGRNACLGHSAFEFVHPDDRQRTKEWFACCVEQGLDQAAIENRQVNLANGQISDMLWTSSFRYDENGEVIRVRGIARDVTDRRRAEDRLRESERMLNDAQALAHVGSYSRDLNTNEITWSAQEYKIFGYEPGMVSPSFEFVVNHVHPEDREMFLRDNQHAVESGESFDLVYRLVRRDGEVRVVHSKSKVVHDASGRPSFQTGSLQDITEQKKIEAALRDSEERFRLMMQQSPSVIELYDADGLQVDANKAYEELWGFPASHTVNEFNVLKSKEVEETGLMEYVKRAYAGESVVVPEYEFDSTGETEGKGVGRSRWLSTRIYPLRDAEGNVHHIVITHEDVSDRRYAEEQRKALEVSMQHAQKLESLGILAGGIAHDFNNLLVAILGNADLALLALPAGSSARTEIEEIAKTAHRCAELTNQMLAYSGKGQFVVKSLDLCSLVNDMRHLLESSISKKVGLRIELPDALPPIKADASQLQQVVMNLVINASEAIGEERGEITVSLSEGRCEKTCRCREGVHEEEQWPVSPLIVLEVTDTGCGMDEQTRSRIFDPFFTTKFAGRGLGMAAVHGIVQGHRAGIEVASELGKGTSFKLYFPLGDEEITIESRVEQLDQAWQGSGTILLVDDEEAVRIVVESLLESFGFSVLTASDGLEAIEVLEREAAKIVCVLLDLTMPKMDGEETFLELRRIRADIPVLLSSGFSEFEVTERFMGMGISGFIQKPYKMNTLKAKLIKVLSN